MPALRRLRQDHRPVCLPCVVMRSISLHCRANRTARQEARGHDPVGGLRNVIGRTVSATAVRLDMLKFGLLLNLGNSHCYE